MKQVFRRAGGGAAVLLGISMMIGACTDEETGFFVLGNVSLDAPQCIARPESSSTLYISGLLDVAIKPDYEATLLVGSQLTPRGDKGNLRTETMITTITGAEVHLYTDTGALAAEFTVPATGVIPPDGGDDPGFGIITATLIPAETGVALANEINSSAEIRTRVAEVRVFGTTIGGLEVESAPFSYVIRVCEGCLIDFPSDVINNQLGCALQLDDAPVSPCRVGQDEAVDCRICRSSNRWCQFRGGNGPVATQ